MLRVWAHGCDQGRVSDGSRPLALYQTLSNSSIECPSLFYFFWRVLYVISFLVVVCLVFVLFCFHALVGAF